MSIALSQLSAQERTTAAHITFGRRARVVVLPGKWQHIAAAVLINADYTVIEAANPEVQSDVIVNTNPDRKLTAAEVTYTPDNLEGFLLEIERRCGTRSSRYAHIISL